MSFAYTQEAVLHKPYKKLALILFFSASSLTTHPPGLFAKEPTGPVCDEDSAMWADLEQASINLNEGRYQQSIALYLRWLPGIMKKQKPELEAAIRVNLGLSFDSLGDTAQAAAELSRALQLSVALGDLKGVGTALLNVGPILRKLGRPDLARQSLEAALQVWWQLRDDASLKLTLANLAQVSLDEGDAEEAAHDVQTALRLPGDPGGQSGYLDTVEACLEGQTGDLQGSIGSANRAFERGMGSGDPEVAFWSQLIVANNLALQGNLEGAYRSVAEALNRAEALERSVTINDFKTKLMDRHADAYAMAVTLSAELGRASDAFRYAEQAKARALLDQLWQLHPKLAGDDSKLLAILQELPHQRARLSAAIQRERQNPLERQDGDLLLSLEKQLYDLKTEETSLLTTLRIASLGHAGDVGAHSESIEDVQGWLDDRATLIEYFISETTFPHQKGGGIYAWVIWKNGFRLIPLAISAREVAGKVILLRNLIGEREGSFKVVAAELFQDLLAPLVPHIRDRKLIIVLHGVLHQLPFVALWNAKRRRYLLDDYVLSFAPSASALDVIYKRGKDKVKSDGIFVLGDPDGSLPYAAQEARKISDLYGVRPLLGRDATESAVIHGTPMRILHLAAHGVYDSSHPLFSYVDLAAGGGEDGRLEMREIFGLNLTGNSLVVLSGCRTEAKEATAGDELAGLPRAFLLAGAKSVVASLWSVDDRSTAFLMERFHRGLKRGLGPADALRRAQIETRSQFSAPQDWAAFAISGAAR